MQNKRIGKGAEEKKYCALFMCRSTHQNTETGFTEEEVTDQHRRCLKEILQLYRPSLLLIGTPGQEAAAQLVLREQETLKEHFPAWLLADVLRQRAEDEEVFAGITKVLGEGREYAPAPELSPVLLPVKKGGLFGALWNLGEAFGCGMRLRMSDIPMRQSVIEICNLYQINPWECDDKGVWLMICKNGRQAEELLRRAGLPAGEIGQITEKAERIFVDHDEVRYLNNPRL